LPEPTLLWYASGSSEVLRETSGKAQRTLIYEFGPFRFLPDEKLLLRDGRPVPLPPKAIDTLGVLLDRSGHVVLKEDLMKRVWPDTFVEEGNLTQQISLLRKALGDVDSVGIETIPRRGYRLMAQVTTGKGEDLLVARERTRAELVVEESVTPAPALPAAAASRWPWALAVTMLAGALAAAGGYVWYTASRPALPFEARDWVLVLDFENTTGDPRFDEALATAFTIGLEQSRYFNVYSKARVTAALRRMGRPAGSRLDETTAAELARRDGVRAFVACSVTRVGEQFLLAARLIDPRRLVTVRAYQARATDDDGLLDALDRLSQQVRQGLGESRAAIGEASRPLPQVTTASFAALLAFVEGSRAWNSGRLQDGIAAWERAVGLDADFALAHAELGNAFLSTAYYEPERSGTHFERALSLTSRTTERERLLIEARFLSSQRQFDDVIRVYDVYLAAYPDDPAAHLNRGLALLRRQRCEEAIAAFEEALRINSANPAALINIATCQHSGGRDREAIGYYEQAFALEPSWLSVPNLLHEFSFTLAGAGDLARAAETLAKGRSGRETAGMALRSLALLDLYQGRYREAETKLRESSRGNDGLLRHARNQIFLSIVRDGQGRPVDRERELDAAAAALAELPPNALFLLRTAAAYARGGAVEKAERLVQSAGTERDEKDIEVRSEWHRALGEIALARGAAGEALSQIEAAHRTHTSPLTLESLAHALLRAGRTDQAIEAYDTLVKTPGWIGWEPQQSWFEAHVRLAALLVARADTTRAASLLDALIERWHEADPDLPLLIEARRLRATAAGAPPR
jgi:DNA-binding winged helix-turn-helix (wHTH) protein/tetratricopeptide (TPR) repeat protein